MRHFYPDSKLQEQRIPLASICFHHLFAKNGTQVDINEYSKAMDLDNPTNGPSFQDIFKVKDEKI